MIVTPSNSPAKMERENGEGELFCGGETDVGRGTVNKEWMPLHRLNCDSLSLAELLPGKKGKFFLFMLDSALLVGHEKSVWPPDSVLIKVSVYFYNS